MRNEGEMSLRCFFLVIRFVRKCWRVILNLIEFYLSLFYIIYVLYFFFIYIGNCVWCFWRCVCDDFWEDRFRCKFNMSWKFCLINEIYFSYFLGSISVVIGKFNGIEKVYFVVWLMV